MSGSAENIAEARPSIGAQTVGAQTGTSISTSSRVQAPADLIPAELIPADLGLRAMRIARSTPPRGSSTGARDVSIDTWIFGFCPANRGSLGSSHRVANVGALLTDSVPVAWRARTRSVADASSENPWLADDASCDPAAVNVSTRAPR